MSVRPKTLLTLSLRPGDKCQPDMAHASLGEKPLSCLNEALDPLQKEMINNENRVGCFKIFLKRTKKLGNVSFMKFSLWKVDSNLFKALTQGPESGPLIVIFLRT